MVAADSVRQKIESSVFVKLNSAGRAYEERYVAHIKVWEAAQDGKGRKSRYIVLSQASDGSGFIHKVKLNCNGSFSLGKTWKLEELREIEVVNSLVFEVTPSATTYRWQAENTRDQTKFVTSLIKLFQAVTGGTVPLRLIGVKVPDDISSPKTSQVLAFPPSSFRVERNTDVNPTRSDSGSTVRPDSVRHPPLVIWKRPIDVSRLPPFPPTPAPVRYD